MAEREDPPMARRVESEFSAGNGAVHATRAGSRVWSWRPRSPACGCTGCLIVIGALVLAGVLAMKSCEETMRRAIPSFSMQQSTTRQVITQLGELEVAARLVVATREIVAETTDEDVTKLAMSWLGSSASLPLGRTVTRLRCSGNRVQYVVDISRLPEGAVTWRDGGVIMVVTLPEPTVDQEMVEVQSDPSKYDISVDKDWLHHALSSQASIDNAHRALREAVVAAGSQPAARAEAREEAKPFLEAVIRGLIPADAGVREVRVEFQRDGR